VFAVVDVVWCGVVWCGVVRCGMVANFGFRCFYMDKAHNRITDRDPLGTYYVRLSEGHAKCLTLMVLTNKGSRKILIEYVDSEFVVKAGDRSWKAPYVSELISQLDSSNTLVLKVQSLPSLPPPHFFEKCN